MVGLGMERVYHSRLDMRRFSHILGPLFGVTLLLIASAVLYEKLSILSLADVQESLRKISHARIAAALALTAVYYVLITGYDALSFKVIGHPLPYRKIALAAFTGYAFSHNVGLTAVSSGSVRYRVHSSFGLTAKESAKVIVFSSLSFWIGFLAVCTIVFLLLPVRSAAALHLPFSLRFFGWISLTLLILYGWYTMFARHGRKIGSFDLPKINPKVFFLQLLIGSLDWIVASSIVFVLLPHADAGLFPKFFGMFVLAQVSGLVSQVPGGIGVFESVMILLLPKHSPRAAIISVLLIYRAIFYILPLIVATVLLATHEVRMTAKNRVKKHESASPRPGKAP